MVTRHLNDYLNCEKLVLQNDDSNEPILFIGAVHTT
ncbi:hypothetical protein XBO1_2530014 [Xenorhabdus bovienii str. oregonense]|uniref:Uncharacterized protein n=1 Tax=Xenorhabdus bovienii str. oregonense TaxID=1398202 RepID=A0A077P7G6_XENBV|nr:hypothetical protein XBO1_2530014 [Xenorhabdus bovienii str. oregonense]